jgi:hypothetical protein
VTIRLFPGLGVELPWPSGLLRFGMTLGEVHGLVASHANLHDTFVCDSKWARKFATDGLELVVFAGETDALGGVSINPRRDVDATLIRLARGRNHRRPSKCRAHRTAD